MEALTSIVSATLEARGVLGKIRAELRANVFSAIHEQQAPNEPVSPALALVQQDPAGALALQLVQDLLSSCALDYTASVLLPEAGMAEAAVDRQTLCAPPALHGRAPPRRAP